MNYLALCVEVQRECDIVGAQITQVANQINDLNRVVNWVKQAYTEIQRRHTNWRWLRSRFSGPTVAGTDTYAYNAAGWTDSRLNAAITRFARWIPFDESGAPNLKGYLQASGVGTQYVLPYLDWSSFRYIYKRGIQQTLQSQPVHFSIDPQDNLVLGPIPNGVFILDGEYQMSAQVLALNTDTPEMPADFHQLIVYQAMRKYAGFESAPDVLSRAVVEGNKVQRQLEASQLPAVATAPPLA